MPLTSASDYAFSTDYDLGIAANGLRNLIEIDDSLSEVSNSLSGSQSVINKTSRALAAELKPVLEEALQHEQAARVPIENVLDVFTTKLRQLETIHGQLNEGRVYRDGFKDGKTLSKDAKKLYKEMFRACDSLIIDPVIGTKDAESALAHAKSLAQQLESRLPQ